MESTPRVTDEQMVSRANDAVQRRIDMDRALRSTTDTPEARESIELKFEALSPDLLREASDLINRVFTPRLKVAGKDLARAFTESEKGLEKRENQIEYNQRYWVAKNPEGRVIGVTGFTQARDDAPTHAWLGWFCIDPDLRGSGTGERLLAHTAQEARLCGIRDLFILTTNRASMQGNEKFYHLHQCPIVAVYDRTGVHRGVGAENLSPQIIDMYASMNDRFWKLKRLTVNIRRHQL